MNTIHRRWPLLVVSFLGCVLVATGCPDWVWASKTESMEAVALGKTKRDAIANAIVDMLEEALETAVGDEVGGDLGESFFEAHGRDADALRKRYFTSDFSTECERDADGVRCLVEAELKFAKLDRDVKKLLKKLRDRSTKSLTFIAQTGVPDTRRNRKLLSQIKKAFIAYGHKFAYVDSYGEMHGFAMSISDISFIGFRYNERTKRADGGIDITFELIYLDPESDDEEIISSDLVTTSTYLAGTNPDTLERKLETLLITEAANSFVRQVNSSIVDFMNEE